MNTESGHNGAFIEEMKQVLLAEQERIQKELGQIAHEDHKDYIADVPEYERNDEVNAMEAADYANQSATTETIQVRLKEIQEALERIGAGTYGKTEEGELIPEERLRANPAATTLVKKG